MKKKRFGGLDPERLMRLAVDEEKEDSTDSLPELPGYRIESVIGKGSAGKVYLAQLENCSRTVAVKLLAPEHTADVLLRERIAREAKIMASLSHPNLVKIYDFIDLESTVGIVMEYIDGVNLRERLRCGDELPIEEAVSIAVQIADALGVVHEAGLIHRDLKPENILISEDGVVKVTDFGIALAGEESGPRLTLTGMSLGTVGYMSPEQVDGLPSVDHRSDIYSLGVVLLELLTGEPPNQILEPPSLYRPEVPDFLNNAVVKAASTSPDDRFASMADFAAAIQARQEKPEKGFLNVFRRKKKS